MKIRLFTAICILIAELSFSQISLEKTFDNELIKTYSNNSNTFYYELPQPGGDYHISSIKIYNADYSLRNVLNIIPPAGYNSFFPLDIPNNYFISQYIFDSDENLEFLIPFYNDSADESKIIFRIYNEEGNILKEFDPQYVYPLPKENYVDFIHQYNIAMSIELFHDYNNNKNKLKLLKVTESGLQTEVWSLPISGTLSISELKNIDQKISAYPVPTNKTLNILNPKNGSDKLEIYDMSGKIILSKSFSSLDIITINVENLTKGTYLYKIGKQSSKFIKN